MNIYTVIPYFSTGDLNVDDVKSFQTLDEAKWYTEIKGFTKFDIVENYLY